MGDNEINDIHGDGTFADKIGQEDAAKAYFEQIKASQDEIKGSVQYLQDLFVRRLNEDKQKTELIKQLEDLSSFAVVEPFVSDMILILDRIGSSEDDFVKSIGEELYDALNRRGLVRIQGSGKFDPAVHKAIRKVENDSVEEVTAVQVIRNGYIFGNRVIRPAEVIVAVPTRNIDGQKEVIIKG